jgi:hypothetical protein
MIIEIDTHERDWIKSKEIKKILYNVAHIRKKSY